MKMGQDRCPHRVARRFCGLCGGWNGDKPGQVGTEEQDGYPMKEGGWQMALWTVPTEPDLDYTGLFDYEE